MTFVNGNTVSDSDELAALEVPRDVLPGARCFNVALASYFRYTISDAALVPDEIVGVAGTDNARWMIEKPGAATDYDGWFAGVVATMKAAAPALTNYREIKIGDGPLATPIATSDQGTGALVPGGGVANSAGTYACLSKASLFQTPKTTSWAIAFRGSLQTSTAGHFNFLGLSNAAGSNDYGVATYSAASATKYLIYTYNGAELAVPTTLSCDDAFHTFVLTFNGTTVKLYIDGTLQASQATLTSVTEEAVFACLFGTVAGDTKNTRFAYGYIAP